ncbi:MAG: cytochrome C oxidase subunit IV family protein [Novosphingobium sp.]
MTATARTLALTWFALMAATVISFVLCELGPATGRWAIPAAMLIAAAKAGAILHYFMELHEGTLAWKLAFGVWLTFCTLLIAGLYFISA